MTLGPKARAWLYSLAAAVIGGASSSIATIAVDPDKFNLSSASGAVHVLEVALWAGVINAAAFLKKSPLPDMD